MCLTLFAIHFSFLLDCLLWVYVDDLLTRLRSVELSNLVGCLHFAEDSLLALSLRREIAYYCIVLK